MFWVIFSCEALWCWTFFAGNFFFIINSFSLVVINLFRLSVSSWFSLNSLHVSRYLFISSRLFNLLTYNCCSIVLWFFVTLWYQLLFLFFNSFFFLVLSHFLLMNLAIVYEFCSSFQKIIRQYYNSYMSTNWTI